MPVINTYQKIVNFTVLRNVVLTSSKTIHHFENWQLIFTWHTISSLENTRVGHFCPLPQIKYAIPDTPNKIELRNSSVAFGNDGPSSSYFVCSFKKITKSKFQSQVKNCKANSAWLQKCSQHQGLALRSIIIWFLRFVCQIFENR